MSTKQATLIRLLDNGIQTVGSFEFDDEKLYSLERPWKDNQHNISSIPAGTYTVTWLYSTDKFPEGVYRVLDVPGRSDIDIHPANKVEELEGCIALGTSQTMSADGASCILQSDLALEHLKAYFGTQDWTLTIKDT